MSLDLAFAAELARERAGLLVRPDRGPMTEARLAPVARRQGLADVAELIEAAREDPAGVAATALVDALASSDTAFFRDRPVFDRLSAEIIPALARRRVGGRVKVWSIGCGSGQEVYSLAMACAEADVAGLELQLFASDMDARALQKARGGLFTHFEVQRGLPVRLLLRWFEKEDAAWRVAPRLRQSVRWASVNLMDDLSRLGPFDVILCRNVLCGFTPEARSEALKKLERILARDGTLVLGAGETVEAGAAFKESGGLFLRDPDASARWAA